MMVMGLFSVFWLSFGMLNLPTLGLTRAYAEGAADPAYNAVIALYLIVWGFALLTFFVFTLKTNTIIALIFFFVTIASWVLAGAYFKVASGDYTTAGQLQKVRHRPLIAGVAEF
jgi:succinate-acetate transporter protein